MRYGSPHAPYVSVTCRYSRLSNLFCFVYNGMKGVFLMQKIRITLSVFHDGQFFVLLFEKQDENGYSVAKRVFAAKPSDIEVLDFILNCYTALSYSTAIKDQIKPKLIKNPKRRQREAAKRIPGVSTKAQTALKAQYEAKKTAFQKASKRHKKQQANRCYELRRQKRKQRHKGK